MDLERALAILAAGHPSRDVDYMLHRADRNGRFPEARKPGDPVPETVARATFDISSAFAAVYRLAPYARNHRLSCQEGVYTFTILGASGRAHLASVAICAGLVSHMLQRLKPRAICEPKGEAPKKLPEALDAAATVRARAAFTPQEAMALPFFGAMLGLSTQAAQLALELRDRLFLTRESDNDAWCSAISAAGKAPRDFIDELDKIKAAVFAMRGEKP